MVDFGERFTLLSANLTGIIPFGKFHIHPGRTVEQYLSEYYVVNSKKAKLQIETQVFFSFVN
jgi:hypothetical protein